MAISNQNKFAGGPGGQKIDAEKAKAAVRDHFTNKLMPIDDIDRQVWQHVTTIPKVSQPVAIVCAVFNLLLPGWGTWIMACASDETVPKTQQVIGLIQFLTAAFLIGWVWSIYWGYLIVMKAMEGPETIRGNAGRQAPAGNLGGMGGPNAGGQNYSQFN